MEKPPKPHNRPLAEVAAAQEFYAKIGMDVGYFSALWHTFNVGHMLATDLDRICRRFGVSVADFNLMGALRIERLKQLRATDLAVTLQVSSGALTGRIVKLAKRGMLTKLPVPGDRRAFTMELTEAGAAIVEEIHAAITRESHFVREVSRLPDEDRVALARIMGELQSQLDRHFLHAHR
jgi:DNA-binding MarR family transcriptional regulator